MSDNELKMLWEMRRNNKIKWTIHSFKRIRERKISADSVVDTVLNGQIVEHYSDDKPFPSYLIFNDDMIFPLHVVASACDEFVYIITAYVPSTDEWEYDYKNRKEQ